MVSTPRGLAICATSESPCELASSRPFSSNVVPGRKAAMAYQYDAALQSASTRVCLYVYGFSFIAMTPPVCDTSAPNISISLRVILM